MQFLIISDSESPDSGDSNKYIVSYTLWRNFWVFDDLWSNFLIQFITEWIEWGKFWQVPYLSLIRLRWLVIWIADISASLKSIMAQTIEQ